MEPYLENLPPELFLQVLEALPHPTQVCELSSTLQNQRHFALEVISAREKRGLLLQEVLKKGEYSEAKALLEARVDPKMLDSLFLHAGYTKNIKELDLILPYINLPALSEMILILPPFLVHYILEMGVNPNPSLTKAIQRGNIDIIRDLIEHGARITKEDIILAVKRIAIQPLSNTSGSATLMNIKILSLLLQQGVSNPIDLRPALELAASINKPRVVRMLLEYGAIPTIDSLLIALRYNLRIAAFLINYGLDPDAENGLPLLTTIRYQSPVAVKFLLDEGVNPNNPVGFELVVSAIEHNVNLQDNLTILRELLNVGGVPPPELIPIIDDILKRYPL